MPASLTAAQIRLISSESLTNELRKYSSMKCWLLTTELAQMLLDTT